MHFRKSQRVVLIATLTALAFAAPVAWSAGQQSQGPEALPHRVVKHAVKKPNGSGIDVTYSVDETVKVGAAATVLLQFDGVTDPAGGSVRFTAGEGLKVSNLEPVRLPPGQSTTVTVLAYPDSEGLVYLNVFTTQNGATAATSIPIQAGKGGRKLRPSGGELKATPSGESVISMPAR